jgi:dimethylargininase
MLRNEGDRLTRVVVSTPRKEYFSVRNLKAHNINQIADPARTVRQHDGLKKIMEDFGTKVIDAPELAGHPNSVFTRDASLCTPTGYIRLRMGLPTRRGEEAWLAGILESLGIPCAGEIEEPGTVEGGDVELAWPVAFVGLSGRTNSEGIRQLSALLEPMGFEVRVAAMPSSYLHLGGAMSVIGPRRIVCRKGVFPKGYFKGFEIIPIDESDERPSSGNVICLRKNEVIANAAENEKTIRILEAEGVKVHGVDLSEFRKGAGGPTCLILPVERK